MHVPKNLVFFVSRKSILPDTEWADCVVKVVEKLGYSTLSQNDFSPGGDWGEWMGKGSSCPYTIAVLSKAYRESTQCIKEWYAARVKDRLIVFRIEDVPCPEGEAQVIYVDLLGKSEEDARQIVETTLAKRLRHDARRNRSRRIRGLVIGLLFLATSWILNLSMQKHEVPPANYAFALGQALASLGLETNASPVTIFEMSLQGIGFPSAQQDSLAKEFGSLDQQARMQRGAADKEDVERARTALETKVISQCRIVFGPELAAHAELGAKNARLLLVLNHWSAYPPEIAAEEAERVYGLMSKLAQDVTLEEDVENFFRLSRPLVWKDPDVRAEVVTRLRLLQKHFDTESRR